MSHIHRDPTQMTDAGFSTGAVDADLLRIYKRAAALIRHAGDRDGDGAIDSYEAIGKVNREASSDPYVQAAAAALLQNSSSYIHLDDARAEDAIDIYVATIADTNRDGRITADEQARLNLNNIFSYVRQQAVYPVQESSGPVVHGGVPLGNGDLSERSTRRNGYGG